MKLFVLLFLVGVASAASIHKVFDDSDDDLLDLIRQWEKDEIFRVSFGLAADEDDDVKTELGKKLKEALDHILEKIKDSLDHGKTVKEELLEKLKEVRDKLKDLHIDVSDKAKELFQKIKDRAKDFLKKLLEKLGLDKDKEERSMRAFDLREMFEKLKKSILDKFDKEAIKERIEKLFGKGSELGDRLLEILKEKGDAAKQKLLDLIDRLLGEKEEETEKRSLAELWEKVKNYFENLKIEIKEKYLKFGEWVKDKIGKGMETGKTKLENLRKIAEQVRDHSKEMSKDIAAEALEFLRPYKEDLGSLWDQVKEKVKDVFNRKDE